MIQAAAAQDYERFYDAEITLRRLRRDPPFADQFTVTVTGAEEAAVRRAAELLRQGMDAAVKKAPYDALGLDIIGPAPAPVVKVNGIYRYRLTGSGAEHRAGAGAAGVLYAGRLPSGRRTGGCIYTQTATEWIESDRIEVREMALRKIALEGEECLTKVCRPVTDFNSRLHTLLDDMADTLAESGGVGLAAPQVGILRRVCVVLDEDDQLIELVNPEIIRTEGEQTGLEGCLSVPGKYGVVHPPGGGARPRTGSGRRMVRGGGRGADSPVLLPRDRASGRPPVRGAHRPADGGRGAAEVAGGARRRVRDRGRRGIMRILFMGTPDFAVASLKRLVADGHDVVCRVHPAGQAEKSRHENDSAACKGICIDRE